MANPNSSTPQCAVPSQPHGQSQSSSGFASLSVEQRPSLEDSQFLAANEATRPSNLLAKRKMKLSSGTSKARIWILPQAQEAFLRPLHLLLVDPSSPDGNESETGDLRPFNRKKRVPRPNEAKLVDSPKSDKINRMYQRRQETYYRRRKIHALNHHRNPEAWNNVALLLDALGTLGTSDDETDNDSEHLNPDRRFKSVRHVNIGFLNPAIAQIWASVESYPTSLRPSRGNRAFKRISKAKSTSKNRMPLSGLPVNFYDPQWLKASPSRFQRGVKAEVPLPILVPHGMGCDEDDDIDMDHDRDYPLDPR
ncbi:hypothetical protein EDB85DRAFT_2158462 [Lactarius pseudohatsudake]|nr:hypothetical protein EDB85DRAFT_2158462 [Lactarius pseudohatsudake]